MNTSLPIRPRSSIVRALHLTASAAFLAGVAPLHAELQELQVSIEVKFVTLSDQFLERLGVDFDVKLETPPPADGPLVAKPFTPAEFEELLRRLRRTAWPGAPIVRERTGGPDAPIVRGPRGTPPSGEPPTIDPAEVRELVRKMRPKGGVHHDPVPRGQLATEGWVDAVPSGESAIIPVPESETSLRVVPKVGANNRIILELEPVAQGDWFRAGEFQFDLFATGAWGDTTRTEQSTKTVEHKESRRIRESQTQRVQVGQDQQNQPIFEDRTVVRERTVTDKETETVTTERTLGSFDGNAFGAGIGGSYFITRNIGVGLEGSWLDGDLEDLYSVNASVIARFPIEGPCHIAPYLIAGLGGQFSDESKVAGFVGCGIEKRFCPRSGVFTEVRGVTDFDDGSYLQVRAGFRFVFGPGGDGVRGAVTEVRVRDGGTVVVGGLKGTEPKKKAPVLGDVPLIGRLFRSKAPEKERENLLIFVTPRIIIQDEEE